jgi:hypothetical protein
LTRIAAAAITYTMSWLDWVAMDPGHSVVWWQVDAAGMGAARAQLERLGRDARLVLRITQEAARGPRTTEVALEQWSGERVVVLGEPGVVHHAAVGLLAGEFFSAIARAQPLTAPALRKGNS